MPKISIIYTSNWGSTEAMATAIFEAITSTGVEVSLTKLKIDSNGTLLSDPSVAAMVDLLDADGIILGSPTYKATIMAPMRLLLEKVGEVDLKGKVGAAFGSYAEAGQAIPILIDWMKSHGIDVIEPGLKIRYKPDEVGIEECKMFGRKIVEKA